MTLCHGQALFSKKLVFLKKVYTWRSIILKLLYVIKVNENLIHKLEVKTEGETEK